MGAGRETKKVDPRSGNWEGQGPDLGSRSGDGQGPGQGRRTGEAQKAGPGSRCRREVLADVVFSLFLVLLDQVSKYLAQTCLLKRPGGSLDLIPGVFALRYLENRGAAFGMMEGRGWIFILFAGLISIIAGFLCLKSPEGRRFRPLRLALAGLLSGAVGNLLDRVFRGYVVDFLYLSLIDFPIFNVADVCVTVSVLVLAVLILFVYKEGELDWARMGTSAGRGAHEKK